MTSKHVEVRHETPADWDRVVAIVRDAFGQPAEAQLVTRLRSVAGCLSLVGTVDGIVVGHAMFSPATSRGSAATVPAFGLAPVSVATAWQRRGVGSQIVSAGLEELRKSGAGVVVVLGNASYYSRFGFVAAAPLGLTCKWGGEDGTFQVLEFVGGAVRAYRGVVEYAPAFDEFAW